MRRMIAGALRPNQILSGLCLVLMLSACGVKLPGEGPPPRLFTLNPKTTFDPNLPKANWQLIVESPTAPASLETVRLALRRTPLELEYYARAAWTDRVPSMVQTLLISSFENTGKIIAVGRESVGLRADYQLKTDIRHFEVIYGPQGPEPHVRIVAKLIRMPERVIVADRTCEYTQAAGSEELEKIVEAYNDVLGRCMRRIVEWTLKVGASQKPGS